MRPILIGFSVAIAVGLLGGCQAGEVEGNSLPDLATIDIPEAQRAALDDGEVTYEEYRQAMGADRDCVVESGVFTEVEPLVEDGLGILVFDASVDVDKLRGATPPAVEFLTGIREACEVEYSSLVALFWLAQRTPSVEERDQLRPLVVDCLEAAGLEIPQDSTDDELFADLRAASDEHQTGTLSQSTYDEVMDCTSQYPDYFLFLPDVA